jgi:hypothetical protein
MTTPLPSISSLVSLSPNAIRMENVRLTVFTPLFLYLSSTTLHLSLIAMQIARLLLVSMHCVTKTVQDAALGSTWLNLRSGEQ